MRVTEGEVATEVRPDKPLTGRVVLVTRAREQAGAFAQRFWMKRTSALTSTAST